MISFANATHQFRNSSESNADELLLAQCRRRDFEAFGKLVDAYQTRVLGFVSRMVHSQEEAEDITQEVFVRAYQSMDRFDGRAAIRTWLFKIAHNLCIDAARRRTRSALDHAVVSQEAEDRWNAEEDTRWNPETVAINAELYEVVDAALETMSEKLRTILLLHDQEQFSYEELSAMLSVPVGTVKSRLFLARAHVQRAVKAYLHELPEAKPL